MGRSVVRQFGLSLVVVLFGSLVVSCGDAQDADRDRNTQSIMGVQCSKAGESKSVAKVFYVCGLNGQDLVWFASISRKPQGAACRKLGAVKKTNATTRVCGNVGKKKLWVSVQSLPTSMISSATSLPGAGAASSTTSADPSVTDASSQTTVAPPATLSPPTTIAIPNSDVQKAAIELSAPSRSVLSTAFAVATSGAVVSPAPTIQLVDEGGNPRGRAGVVVKVLVDREDVAVEGGRATTNDEGLATFGNLVLRGYAGLVQVTFEPEGLASVTASVDLVPGAPVELGYFSDTQTVVAGTEWTAAVYFLDTADNFAGPVGAEVTAQARGGAVLGKATTDDLRVARFSLPVRKTAGEWEIEFVGPNGIEPAKVKLQVVASTADRLVVDTALPELAVNDTPISGEIKVHIADRYGNMVKSPDLQINLAVVPHELPISENGAAASLPQGTVKNESATIDESGYATFDNPTIVAEAGVWNLSFSSPDNVELNASHGIEVVAGAARELRLVRNPAGARSGVAFAVQPSLTLVDVSGNVISEEGIVFTAGAPDGYTLANATATTGSDGVATFTDLKVSGKAGNVTMSFNSPLMPAIQKEISLAAGPIEKLNVLAHATSAVAGVAFTSDSSIGVADAQGNAITEPVTVLGKCAGSDTWTGVQTNTDGVAIFSGQVVTRAATVECEYRYTTGSKELSTKARVAVVAASATTVEFVTQPPTTASMGGALSPAPAVRLVDSYGNRVEKAGVTVTALNSDRSLEISNNSVTTDAAGIATFGTMTFGGTIGSYRLSFAPSGGVAVQAAANTVFSAGAASRVEVRRQLDGLASGWRATTQPTLRVNDRWGNAVAESGWIASVTLIPVLPNSSFLSMLEVTGNSATSGVSGQINFVNVAVAGRSGITYLPLYRVKKGLVELPIATGLAVGLAPGRASQFTYEIDVDRYPYDGQAGIASGGPIGRIRQSDAKGNPVNATGARRVTVAYERGQFPNSGMSWGRQVEPDVTADGVTTLGYRIYGEAAATGVLRVTVDDQAAQAYNVSLTSAAVIGDPGPSGGLLLTSSSSSSPRFTETAPAWAAGVFYYSDIPTYVSNLTIDGVGNWTLPTSAHTTQMMEWSNAGRLTLPSGLNGTMMVDSSMTVRGRNYPFWILGVASKQSLPYGLGWVGVLPVRSFG
jgi:hypothetical protein